MGAGDLSASLLFNSNAFDIGIAKAESRLDHFASHFERKFGRKFSHTFGAGFLAGALVGPLEKIKEFLSPEDLFKGVQEGANRLHVTPEEFQQIQMAARDARMSVDEWTESVKSGRIPLADALKTLEQYRGQVRLSTRAVEEAAEADAAWADMKADLQSRFGSGIWLNFKKGFAETFASIFDPAAYHRMVEHEMQISRGEGPGFSSRGLAAALSPQQHPMFSANEWQHLGGMVGADIFRSFGSSGPVQETQRQTVTQLKLLNVELKRTQEVMRASPSMVFRNAPEIF